MKTQQLRMRVKLLFSLLFSLLCYNSSIAQNNYLKAGSVEGITIYQHGSGGLWGQTHTEMSINTQREILWFLSASGIEPASGVRARVGKLNISLTNTSTEWRKVTLYDLTGTQVLRTQNIAPAQVINWDAPANFGEEDRRLDAAKNYYWKMEAIVSQTVTCLNDAITMPASNFTNMDVLENDVNIPAGADCRLKVGQTLTGITVTKNEYVGLRVVTGATQGVYSFVYEVVSSAGTVLGEATATITVIAGSQYCTLEILSSAKQAGSSTIYDFILYSPNAQINPFNYEIRKGSYVGEIVKRGTTPAATGNKESVDFAGLATGTYFVKFSSTVSECYDFESIEFVSATEQCTLSATSVRSIDSYVISIPAIPDVTNYYYVFANSADSIIAKGLTTDNSFTLNFAGKKTGEYRVSIKPNSITKICSQNLVINWVTSQVDNNRGYLKKYNNVQDYFELAGIGDYTGTKDAGTGWITKENRTALVWKAYIKSLNNATGAKAILTLREDSSSISKHVSISIEADKIKVLQRMTKGGNNVIVTEVSEKTVPRWLQIRRNGNTAILEESNDAPDSEIQTFTTLTTINSAFSTWKPLYYKGLYVNSANSSSLASAEFHRFFGGPYTGTTQAIDNSPLLAPIVSYTGTNPTANTNLILNATACKSGYSIQYYKNGLPISTSQNYNVTVTYGDNYKARCEKGTSVSAYSNVITFTAPSLTTLCGVTDELKLGTKTVGTTAYDMYARIFDGKLWLTQSLRTTPESFLVRAVNFLSINFIKSWTGTDYSCFEGQSSEFGGVVEPAGFTTPDGYNLTTTQDGAKIYTLGLGGNASITTPSISSIPAVPVAGNSTTFTAAACSVGTVKWFNGSTQVGTGTIYSISSPVVGNTYTAICTLGNIVSSASNAITISENTGNEVPVFLFWGESNAGTRNTFSTASPGDLGVRTGVRILNNSNNMLETLKIASTQDGGNSSYGERDCTANTNWGWEVPASNYFASGALQKSELIIIKVAQGGSLIGQWNDDIENGYFQTAQTRINAVKAQLANEGKVPKWFIFYSQGINNATPNGRQLTDPTHFSGTGITYWGNATSAILPKINTLTSTNAKIVMSKFGATQYGDYLNAKIDEICNASNGKYIAVSADGLTVQSDQLHWDANSTKTVFSRMMQAHSSQVIAPPVTQPGVVTISEPNRSANYYKASSGNADIIYRYYLNPDDNVYLENGTMKIGISLRGGGAITYLSKAGSTVNVVNNANDGGIGRQIQPDYYQKPANFSVQGKATSFYFPNNGYNTTLGGDDFRNVPTLLDYHATTDGYYIKFKPLVWGIDGHVSEITMEVTYKLEGNSLRADYIYTSERTDNQRYVPTEGQLSFDGWSIPTLHMNKFFTKIHTYGRLAEQTGSQDITQDLPTNVKDTTTPVFSGLYPIHGWAAIEAPSQNLTLGIINKKISYVRSERKNIVNENTADDKDDAVTIVEFLDSPPSIDTNLRRVRTDSVYYTIGTIADIKAKAASIVAVD